MEELKPCPFCGSKADLGGYDFSWYVRCTAADCWARVNGSLYESAEEAITAWNRRALPSPSAWRTMESAPRDYTPVLLVEGGTNAVGEAHWMDDERGWWWANCYPTDYQDRKVFNPTHWQPLPSPPESADHPKGEG